MKSRLLAAAIAGFALVGSTGAPLAADPPSMAPVIAPYSWYGFWIGVQGGYGWSGDAVEFVGETGIYAGSIGSSIPLSLGGHPSGGLGGIQWGTNYQFGRWVLGTASDYALSDISSREVLPLGTRTNFVEHSLESFGTTRARIGYTIQDNVLAYATGGLAKGRNEVTVSNFLTGGPCGAVGACPFFHRGKTLWGWAVGGGLEYARGPWSVNVEYIHYDLGDRNFVYGDGFSPSVIAARSKVDGDILRAGINYRFNWTPWELLFKR